MPYSDSDKAKIKGREGVFFDRFRYAIECNGAAVEYGTAVLEHCTAVLYFQTFALARLEKEEGI